MISGFFPGKFSYPAFLASQISSHYTAIWCVCCMQSIIISGIFQLIFVSLAFHKFFVIRHFVAYMKREEAGYAPSTVFVCTGHWSNINAWPSRVCACVCVFLATNMQTMQPVRFNFAYIRILHNRVYPYGFIQKLMPLNAHTQWITKKIGNKVLFASRTTKFSLLTVRKLKLILEIKRELNRYALGKLFNVII